MSSLLIYRQSEQDALKALGFRWIEDDKEWVNDTGLHPKILYMEHDNGDFAFILMERLEEVQGYKIFGSIEQLQEYLK